MKRLAPMLRPVLGLLSGIAVLAAAAACSPQAQDRAGAGQPSPADTHAVHPVSGLEVIPLTITQDGKVHRFRVEAARSDEAQTQGLMFRTEMGADEGMIFPRRPARIAGFWMRNTVIPLDMIFIGPDGRILNIAENTVPYSLEPYTSAGPVIAVLELNGGRSAELGIGPGARVEW